MKRRGVVIVAAVVLTEILTYLPAFSQENSNIVPGSKKMLRWEDGNKSWAMRLIGFGLGYGSRSNVGYGRQNPGLVASIDALTLAWGFDKLNGVGFGTSIYEAIASGKNNPAQREERELNLSSHGLPESFLPLYVYYPIFTKSRWYKYPGRDDIGMLAKTPFIYAFAGGSGWGNANNYLHAGVSALWSMGYGPSLREGGPDLPMYWGFQTGFFLSSGYTEDNNVSVGRNLGLYVSLKLGYGGNNY